MRYGSLEKYKDANGRHRIVLLALIFAMLLLAVRLFFVTMLQHENWSKMASEQNTKTVYTPSARGNIYDVNGVLLAGNRPVFTLQFNSSGIGYKDINRTALAVMKKLEEQGDTYDDDFPIERGEDGSFRYTFDTDREKWLKDRGYPLNLKARDLFDSIREKYRIDPGLNREEAMNVLVDEHNVYLPVYAKKMKYTYTMQKSYFLQRCGYSDEEIEKGISAKKCFADLKKHYGLKKGTSDEDARRIFIIRDKVARTRAQSYLPVTIASRLSEDSVVYFEEADLPGIEVVSATERYYPFGHSACHMLGYMGAISDTDSSHYQKNDDYLISDLVGQSGIEASFEKELHGKPGYETMVINSSGDAIATLKKQEGQKGADIYTSFDINFQQKVEEALKERVDALPAVRSGAAVVLDVKTARVLALASYPDFDLNAFADGISAKEWEAVQAENPRDDFSAAPLFNNVTQAAVAPGSTFKPITAMTALECGLDPNRIIMDRGHIDIGGRTFACFAWNTYGGTDGPENLTAGIGNSCNYYFACIATGKDWGTGASLGYSEDITLDKINKRARDFGLGEKTGIEILENRGTYVSAATKIENYKYYLKLALQEKARTYFPEEVYANTKKLEKNLNTIASWIEDNPSYGDLITLLDENTDVLKDRLEDCASMVKFDYFQQADFGTFDVFNTCIGQGDNTYTPLQVCNYIATLGNHGIRHRVSLISGVEADGLQVPQTVFDTKLNDSDRAAVLRGMQQVIANYSSSFPDMPVSVAGKTGTAQYQAIKQPASEIAFLKERLGSLNAMAGTSVTWEQVEKESEELIISSAKKYSGKEDAADDALIEVSDHKITQGMIDGGKDLYEDFAWMVVLAPVEDPQIAVAVLLPEGHPSSNAGVCAGNIVRAYFEKGGPAHAEGKKTYVGTADNGKNAFY